MDDKALDSIARLIGAARSRRALIAAVGAAALLASRRSATVESVSAPERKKRRTRDKPRRDGVQAERRGSSKCKGGKKRCGKKCIDTKNDKNNCGRCDFSCNRVSGNMRCRNGACECEPGYGFCKGKCVKMGTASNCSRCGETCVAASSCETVSCNRSSGCTRMPKSEGASCGANAVCTKGKCLDYNFPGTMKLPWCDGARNLTQGFDTHTAQGMSFGLAVDFGRPPSGIDVRDTEVVAPMAGTAKRQPTTVASLGNHVLIDGGNGWGVILAHLGRFDVADGAPVKAGDPIGTLSDNGLYGHPEYGCASGCPHIHADLVLVNGGKLSRPDWTKVPRMYGISTGTFNCGTSCSLAPTTTQACSQGSCTSGFTMTVDAKKGWQTHTINWPEGSWHTYEVISGQWTHWKGGRALNPGSGENYICANVHPASECGEPMPTFNLGALLARVSGSPGLWGPPSGIGQKRTLQLTGPGGSVDPSRHATQLGLRINDADSGLYDNDGVLTVRVCEVPAPRSAAGRGSAAEESLVLPSDRDSRKHAAAGHGLEIAPTPTSVPDINLTPPDITPEPEPVSRDDESSTADAKGLPTPSGV